MFSLKFSWHFIQSIIISVLIAASILLVFYTNSLTNQQVTHFQVPLLTPSQQSAGAGGSSVAYYLSKSYTNTSKPISITVYEKESQVGGRVHIVNFERNDTKISIELGASIFVDLNYHLVNAAKKFGLEFMEYEEEYPDSRLGIWDGENFVFVQSSNSLLDKVKFFWKYGWAKMTVQRMVDSMIDKFQKTYEFSEPFFSVDSEIERLHVEIETQFNAQYYFSELKNVNSLYLQNFVEPMTRVNYGQNLGEIHVMGAFISLAPQGAKSIRGGNYQIFENFIKHSEAKIRLDTEVTKITKVINIKNDKEVLKYNVETKNGELDSFDAIVLATPIQFSKIEFENINVEMKEIQYVTLHVTLIAGRVNPAYFGYEKIEEVPQQIVTTNSGKTEFLSFTTELVLENGETLHKIFSHQEMNDKVLDRIFTERSWIFKKVWKSYPRLIPNQPFPRVEVDDNFFYTMETECVSGGNIVKLLVQRLSAASQA
ncbi:15371_t:CDS:2 [Acaulospora colombiana]|uniref:15371_t:CDS:1 n=1 Tax=Acaulospora colombiana TaxID=27376 RepID=A0ACA9K9B4_9GLOM|nr:15371_t:CDS:2 [Acaulospora colombiana]